jgi:hypothetical protein
MGAESLLLIFLCVVYGYHATVLLFGTSHCLAIVLGERQLLQCEAPPLRSHCSSLSWTCWP